MGSNFDRIWDRAQKITAMQFHDGYTALPPQMNSPFVV